MSSAAQDLATYIVEPTGTDIYAPDGYTLRKRFQGTDTTTTYANTAFPTLLQDIDTEAFNTTANDIQGGRIYLKNGLYTFSGTSGVWFSDDADADDVKCRLEGETRDGTIIRSTMTGSTTMIGATCNMDLVNLTLDGNDSGTAIYLYAAISNNSGNPKYIRAENVRFMRSTGYCMRSASASNFQFTSAVNCIFEKPGVLEDMCSLHGSEFVLIDGNFFDRTNGTYTGNGQSITFGNTNGRTIITNNIIKHLSTTGSRAISLEPTFSSRNIIISDNIIEHGRIGIGVTGAYAFTVRDVTISNNQLLGGGIEVFGPTSGDTTTQIKYVWIENNVLKDALSTAMKLEDLAGLVSCRNNKIVNSNTESASGNHGGLIWVTNCTDADVEYNILEMNDSDPVDADYSKYGIRYDNLTNSRIMHNTIMNNTTQGQVSYQDGGTNTTTKVSRNSW